GDIVGKGGKWGSKLFKASKYGDNVVDAIKVSDDVVDGARKSKVLTDGASNAIENPIIGKERVGSALRDDFVYVIRNDKNQIIKEFPATAKGHGFSDIIDNYAGDAVHTKLPDGADLYQLSGSNNGVSGRFEWIVENGKVTHRMFIENGIINGRPILP
ncbi:MAG: hypothetical protein GX275_14430, partial [Clostridiales bacterium]|nr:hypothetical protein [Clostridiales bacterium]